MADIKYVHILNSFVSTEGFAGNMTNYIYYSLLVVYKDNSRSIVEGKAGDIKWLLPYVRTPQDKLPEIKESIRKLREDINSIVDEKMGMVSDTLYPIPDIQGRNEIEALESLKNAGLTPHLVYSYPEGTPRNGIVENFRRRKDNFKTIDLEIVHEIPDVTGLSIDEAAEKLREAGMEKGQIYYSDVSKGRNGVILNAFRAAPDSLEIHLKVSVYVPDTTGMDAEEAVSLLQQNGYEVEVTDRMDKKGSNKVLEWRKTSDTTVIVVVSRPTVTEIRPRKCDVVWNNMADSTGDTYMASVEYNTQARSLEFQITADLQVKSKHKVTQVRGLTGSKSIDVYMRPFVSTLEFSKAAPLSFYVRWEDEKNLPGQVSIILETQYGIVKKTDDITLEFTLEW